MRTILDVKEFEKPEKNDLIIFDGTNWKISSQVNYLAPLIKFHNETQEKIKILENELETLVRDVNLSLDRMNKLLAEQTEKIAKIEADIRYLKGEE